MSPSSIYHIGAVTPRLFESILETHIRDIASGNILTYGSRYLDPL